MKRLALVVALFAFVHPAAGQEPPADAGAAPAFSPSPGSAWSRRPMSRRTG